MTGQAGIGLASVIILLSMCVTIVTTMSMSAICTNGEVKGGMWLTFLLIIFRNKISLQLSVRLCVNVSIF